jgi:HAMP domain-containing protein
MDTTIINRQWATRPADERFTSLPEMLAAMQNNRELSRGLVISNRSIELLPAPDHKGLSAAIALNGGAAEYIPTNWAFGQLAQLAGAPAGYLRDLPAELAADCVNYGLRFNRDVADVGALVYDNGRRELRAATGPGYGRVWHAEILRTLIDHVGDGINGRWRVPGEFGEQVEITKQNTTLYGSDRDMFIFLCDEANRIEIPNRRDGKPGSLARGFFITNSETGKSTLKIGTMLFDFICANRTIWGAQEWKEVSIRHTSGAPDRWLEEVQPALISYATSASARVLDTVTAAQNKKIDDIDDFLAKRLTRRQTELVKLAHESDEGRPIESVFDAVNGITAYARTITHQDRRTEIETIAGDVLELAAA